MAKLKPEPRFARRKVRLTADEFASLKEVGTRRCNAPSQMRTEIVWLRSDTFGPSCHIRAALVHLQLPEPG
jgi:hypothetical protein